MEVNNKGIILRFGDSSAVQGAAEGDTGWSESKDGVVEGDPGWSESKDGVVEGDPGRSNSKDEQGATEENKTGDCTVREVQPQAVRMFPSHFDGVVKVELSKEANEEIVQLYYKYLSIQNHFLCKPNSSIWVGPLSQEDNLYD